MMAKAILGREHGLCPQCGQPVHGLLPLLNSRWGCEDCYLGETGYFFAAVSVFRVEVCPRGHALVVEDSPRVGWVCCPTCKAASTAPLASQLDLDAARTAAYLERAERVGDRAAEDVRQLMLF